MWIIYAVLAAVLWGLNYSLSEKILQNISPLTLLALETMTGALVFFLLSWFTSWKKDWQTLSDNRDILLLLLLEIVVVLGASFLIVISIRAKNATAAGIIELIYPLFTIFFTWVLFRQLHVNTSIVTGGILIFLGVLMVGK